MWPFDDDSALPLRDGIDVGGAQERQMAVIAGGYGGVRTVEERNPDGSITTLRTRGGNPIFETTAIQQAGASSALLRGFVAKATSRAVLFDPYTLEVLNANYTLATNTSAVMDFATAWNVPTGDDTDWYDVVLFDGTTIKVNAKAMPTLLITANHGYPAIPYVINRETAEDQYGNAERNTTEKRVFAVGRSDVKAWGGGGVVETLTPTAPRSEDRAMTIGQRLDFASDKAWLGQIYHPSAGWDAAGEWAFTSAEVTMLLASSYLSKVAGSADVAQPICSLASVASTSPSSNTPVALPAVELCAVGVGEVGETTFTPEGLFLMFQWVYWPCREAFSYQVPGSKDITGTALNWSGASSQSNNMAGRTVDYAASNSLTKGSHSETYTFESFSAPLFTTVGGTYLEYQGTYFASGGGSYTWPTVSNNLSPRDANGQGDYDHVSGNVGASATYTSSSQSGSSSAQIGATSLVDVSFSRYKESGDKVTPTPITGRFAAQIADPYLWLSQSSGTYEYHAAMTVSMYTLDPLHADVIGKRQPLIEAKAAEVASGGRFYDNENDYNSASLYTGAVSARDTVDNQSLSWSTVDYLLFDDPNGVYVSLECEFSGSQAYGGYGTATLTIIIKVQTRYHSMTEVVSTTDYTYSELLPERDIGGGHSAVPSPQIRAIFAPLYQEQGSFKGAHYVTQAEEGNGATPAHLFNFLLYLRPYGDIGTINDDNLSSPAVHFVPCNLLEMLYAFVFSQEYGVAESGERYPVTFTTRYTDMMDTLFSTPIRVAVRDGTQAAWSDVFGPDFASIPTVSLHRA